MHLQTATLALPHPPAHPPARLPTWYNDVTSTAAAATAIPRGLLDTWVSVMVHSVMPTSRTAMEQRMRVLAGLE
jgi:hypothetical protein